MSPAYRIRRLIARQGKLEDAAAKAQKLLLQALRRDVMAEIVQADGFRQWQLGQILAGINRYVDDTRAAAERSADIFLSDAWDVGIDFGNAALEAAGVEDIGSTLYGLSDDLLTAAIDLAKDQTRGIYSELGRTLKTTVRRATFGISDPFEAMGNLARAIKDPKTFGNAFNRAETVIRTEVNSNFALANNRRGGDANGNLAAAGLRLTHWWLSAEDQRVRPAHAEAAEKYSKENAIPFEEPFIVDGEELKHPLDPSASPANRINCRCNEMFETEEA